MSGNLHGLHPAFLAYVDRARAETAHQISELAEAFRAHVETAHDGDPTCSHALAAYGLYIGVRTRIDLCDLVGSALSRIVDLERTVAMYQAAEQETGRPQCLAS